MALGLTLPKNGRKKNVIGWALSGILVLAAALMGWYYYSWYVTGSPPPVAMPLVSAAQPGISTKKPTAKQVAAYTVPPTHPRYISIEALGINKARVTSVGVTDQNVLDVPDNIYDTSWYDKSMTPGSGYGAVVIDGHSGGYANNGIFSRLDTLQTGDQIMIERGDGKKYTYAVVSNETMSLEEANKTGMKKAMQSADETKEGLSLISCAGNYVPRIAQYDKRVITRAVRID